MNLTADMIADDLDVVDTVDAVDVQQVDADAGSVSATASPVTVLKRQVQDAEVAVDGGNLKVTTCRFHLKAGDMVWVPKKRDRVVDGDETWVIDGVKRSAFGTIYVCETTLQPE